MLKGIIIAVLVYSLILTVALLYEDNSSFYSVELLDIILAGPFAWAFMLFQKLFEPLLNKIYDKIQNAPYKRKNARYIKRIVKSIVRKYKKSYAADSYVDFDKITDGNISGIEGYTILMIRSPLNEWVNRKFSSLMRHQEDELIQELKNYFHQVTLQEMIEDDCCDYFIETNKEKVFYKIN